jgi:hypothetical protein
MGAHSYHWRVITRDGDAEEVHDLTSADLLFRGDVVPLERGSWVVESIGPADSLTGTIVCRRPNRPLYNLELAPALMPDPARLVSVEAPEGAEYREGDELDYHGEHWRVIRVGPGDYQHVATLVCERAP